MSVEATAQYAHAALRAAHEVGYRYPEIFRGFAADIAVTDGVCQGVGRIVAPSPRVIDVCLPGTPGELTEWVKQALASELMHRWPRSYEEADGRYQLALEPAPCHPLGDLIRVLDDPFNSSYRVRDGMITLVSREMGDEAFQIITQQRQPAPDGRLLPTQYVVIFRDRVTGLLRRTSVHTVRYTVVSGIVLPEEIREVVAEPEGLLARELRLSAHQVLLSEQEQA